MERNNVILKSTVPFPIRRLLITLLLLENLVVDTTKVIVVELYMW
jgi:hypothetical protein